MTVPSHQQICTLYRLLLRYGEQLKLTEKTYYFQRIKSEFRKNKRLADQTEIQRVFQVVSPADFISQVLALKRLI